jgi:hypothetical protein
MGAILRVTHVYRSFNFLDPFSQLSIPGYLPPHSFYDTAGRNKSAYIEIPAYLLQIIASKSPQQIHRNNPRFI